MNYRNQILQGNSLDLLPTLPENSVDTIFTSPPYWGLREYETKEVDWANGWTGELGREPTPAMYTENLCKIMDATRHALKPEGSLWVNLDDSMAKKKLDKVSRKSLVGIPARFQIAMIERGWVCRNMIIWHKPDVKPESATDRYTRDYEHLFLFSQDNKTLFWVNSVTGQFVTKQPLGIQGIEDSDWRWVTCRGCWGKGCNKCKDLGKKKRTYWEGKDYYFEQQFEAYAPNSDVSYRKIIRAMKQYDTKEPYKDNMPYAGVSLKDYEGTGAETPKDVKNRILQSMANDARPGRNKRTVWSIHCENYKGAHFAVFPIKLAEAVIKAACPRYVCSGCGKPRLKLYNTKSVATRPGKESKYPSEIRSETLRKRTVRIVEGATYSDCGCKMKWEPGVIMDLFFGSGTVGVAALNLGRQYLGLELNPKFVKLAEERITEETKQGRLLKHI